MVKNHIQVVGLVVSALLAEPLFAQSGANASKPNNPVISRWAAQRSSIEKTLIQNYDYISNRFDIQVLDAFGSAEKDPAIALISFYPGVGAYTEPVVAMRMEGGVPILARFRDKNGKDIPTEFLSGASVMHTVDVILVPKRKAIYSRFFDNDSGGRLARCGVKSYVWNPKMRTFDEDEQLSNAASDEFCRSLRAAR